MTKIKVNELTNKQMNYICKKNVTNKCQFCPLRRFRTDEKNRKWELIFCYKQLRAWYYANIEWYKNNIPDEDKRKILISVDIDSLKQDEQQEIEIDEELL